MVASCLTCGQFRVFLHSAFGAAAVALPMLASGSANAAEDPSVASSRMSYSRFLEYLEMGRVKKVSMDDRKQLLTLQGL